MAGYILVDVKTKKVVGICSAIALCLFILGIIIGYFSGRAHAPKPEPSPSKSSIVAAIRSACSMTTLHTPEGRRYFERYLERHGEKHACVNSAQECLDYGQPRHYITYHLNQLSIEIDGRLDDKAWTEVPWSEKFVDMRSDVYPKPYLETKFKMRWNKDRLYIGAYIQEKNLWATLKEHDSSIWKENGFEVLMDVDGTMFNYKQAQINVHGTMMDQILFKSPHDGPGPIRNRTWHPDARKEVYAKGTINKADDEDSFWTAEMSFSFTELAKESIRNQPEPLENEVWFIQFGRSEQHLIINDAGEYEKEPNSTTDWWSWQPCDAINLHLQDRWGLMQFKTNIQDKKFEFQKWHIYKALFDMFDAVKTYKALNSRYTTLIEELDVPPYLLSRTCVDIPEVKLVRRETTNSTGFEVTVRSMFLSHKPAHIREDRYVWFD